MIRLARPNVNSVTYWDRRYRDEVDAMWKIWTTGDLIEKIADQILLNAEVLDVGCGAGIVPTRIAEIRPDIHWSACDFSPESIAYLRRLRTVKFGVLFVADLERSLPVDSGAFDITLCTEVLEHLERPSLAVRELVRIARSKIIVSVPNGKSIDSREHIWWYTPEGLRKLFQEYGDLKVELARKERNLIGILCK